jgi:hypothetical protein
MGALIRLLFYLLVFYAAVRLSGALFRKASTLNGRRNAGARKGAPPDEKEIEDAEWEDVDAGGAPRD